MCSLKKSIKNVCRLCLASNNLVWVFDKKTEYAGFHRLIQITTSVVITENDPVSQKICSTCGEEIIRIFKFRSTAIKNDQELRGKSTEFVGSQKLDELLTEVEAEVGKEISSLQIQSEVGKANNLKTTIIDPNVIDLTKILPKIKLPPSFLVDNLSPVIILENQSKIIPYIANQQRQLKDKSSSGEHKNCSKTQDMIVEAVSDCEAKPKSNNIILGKNEASEVFDNGNGKLVVQPQKIQQKLHLQTYDYNVKEEINKTNEHPAKIPKLSETNPILKYLDLVPTSAYKPHSRDTQLLTRIKKSQNLFSCTICTSIHYSHKELKMHRLKHLRCHFCKLRVKTLSSKTTHLKRCRIRKTTFTLPKVILTKLEDDKEVRQKYPEIVDAIRIKEKGISEIIYKYDSDKNFCKNEINFELSTSVPTEKSSDKNFVRKGPSKCRVKKRTSINISQNISIKNKVNCQPAIITVGAKLPTSLTQINSSESAINIADTEKLTAASPIQSIFNENEPIADSFCDFAYKSLLQKPRINQASENNLKMVHSTPNISTVQQVTTNNKIDTHFGVEDSSSLIHKKKASNLKKSRKKSREKKVKASSLTEQVSKVNEANTDSVQTNKISSVSIVRPHIKINGDTILMNLKGSDFDIMKMIMKTGKLIQISRDVGPELPDEKLIIPHALDNSIDFTKLKQLLAIYPIPVEIYYNAVYTAKYKNCTLERQEARKMCIWNNIKPVDLSLNEVKCDGLKLTSNILNRIYEKSVNINSMSACSGLDKKNDQCIEESTRLNSCNINEIYDKTIDINSKPALNSINGIDGETFDVNPKLTQSNINGISVDTIDVSSKPTFRSINEVKAKTVKMSLKSTSSSVSENNAVSLKVKSQPSFSNNIGTVDNTSQTNTDILQNNCPVSRNCSQHLCNSQILPPNVYHSFPMFYQCPWLHTSTPCTAISNKVKSVDIRIISNSSTNHTPTSVNINNNYFHNIPDSTDFQYSSNQVPFFTEICGMKSFVSDPVPNYNPFNVASGIPQNYWMNSIPPNRSFSTVSFSTDFDQTPFAQMNYFPTLRACDEQRMIYNARQFAHNENAHQIRVRNIHELT